MIRKLALAVSLAIGGLCVPVHALGLGEIDPKSALNQKFNADIDLLSVQADELDSVKVGLASNDDFARAGVERPYYLSQLNFQPMMLENGEAVVRVTSDQPVREPFLNFLVEVNWPKGRMVREYTALLDPPTTTLRRPGRIQVASASRAAPVKRLPRKTTPAPKPVNSSNKAGAAQYGPITNDDTAWSIAKRYRHQGVTMAQMLMGLLKANPNAFVDGNINHMRNGQILRIPSKQEVLDIEKQQAQQEFRQQKDAWMTKRTEALKALPSKTKAAKKPVQTRVVKEPEAQLRIATSSETADKKQGAGDGVGTAKAPEIRQLRDKLAVAQESAEASRQQSETLRSRMDDLEARLADMQRLLQLKDEQLAQLQARIAEGDTAPAPTQPESVVKQIPKAEEKPAETEEADPLDEIMADMKEAESKEEPEPEVAIDPATIAQPESEPVVEQPAPEVEEKPADKPKSSWMDDMLPAAAGGGALIAALLGFLVWRRRQSSKEEETDNTSTMLLMDDDDDVESDTSEKTIVDKPETKDVDDEDVFGDDLAEIEPGDNDQPTGDSSFLSEFSPSEINALNDETGEVDPVSEADVYLAYGRYQQAEDLLKQAIDRDPDRVVLSQKLAEVHYATRDKDAFAALASEMAAKGMHESDAEGWSKIVEMGRELAPSHALFADADIDNGDGDFDDLLDVDDVEDDVDDIGDLGDVDDLPDVADAGLDNLEDDIDNMDLDSPIDEDSLALGEFELSELASDFLPDGEVGKPEDDGDLELDAVSELADQFGDLEQPAPSAIEEEADDLDLSEFKFDEPAVSEEDLDVAESLSEPVTADSEPEPVIDALSDNLDDLVEPEVAEQEFDFSQGLDTGAEDTGSDFAVPSESELVKVGQTEDPIELDSDLDGDLLDIADIETSMLTGNEESDSDFSKTIESIPAFDTDSGVADLQAQLDELSDLAGLDDDYASALPESQATKTEEPDHVTLDSPAAIDDVFDQVEDGDPADDIDSFGADDPLLGDGDEISTKLDLASAYIEMGDPEGAKSILEEVYADGNEEQKAQADKLMEGLNG